MLHHFVTSRRDIERPWPCCEVRTAFFQMELLIVVIAVIVAICNASIHRLPIYRWEVILDLRFAPASESRSIFGYQEDETRPAFSRLGAQRPLNSVITRHSAITADIRRSGPWDSLRSKHTDGMIYFLVYTTDVQVGNPRQPFRAEVDLNWGDFYIPSVNCTYGCNEHWLYNSSQSSTYIPDLTPARVLHAGNTWGNISQDSLHVGGIEIQNQRFEEVTRWNAILYDELFDGSLGLARLPFNFSQATVGATYPFQNMVAQELLDRNLFSLTLSSSRSKSGGELILGAIDHESYEGKLVTIPVSHVTGGVLEDLNILPSSGWQVPIKRLSIGSKDPALGPLTAEFAHHVAVFASTFPWMIFPVDVVNVRDIRRRLGVTNDYDEAVSCEERSSLPNLTLSFGEEAHEIVLTPWDYLYEVENVDGPGTLCALPFENVGEEEAGPGYVYLGSAFLGGLYTVFDADDKSISCMLTRFSLPVKLQRSDSTACEHLVAKRKPLINPSSRPGGTRNLTTAKPDERVS